MHPPLHVLGESDLAEVVLAERGAMDDLSRLGSESITVYVCAIRNPDTVERREIDEKDIEMLGWADVARVPSLLPSELGTM